VRYAENTPDKSSRNWSDPPVPRLDYGEEQFGVSDGVATLMPRRLAMSPWLFVVVTALNTVVAAVVAIFVTLSVARQELAYGAPEETASVTATTRPAIAVGNERAPWSFSPQPIGLLPIGSPDQPLRLDVQKPARLPLQIQPEEAAGREPFTLALSGLPNGTTLFGAARIASDRWFLPAGASNQLEISVPEWSTSVFEVTIMLQRTTGEFVAQTKAWIAVPPPISRGAAAMTLRSDDDVVKELLEANRLLERGDIVAARAVYQQAAEMGNASAALMLGSTYDPGRLWSFGIMGMTGNKERARQWYLRAAELGHPDAKTRLMALGN
jgi:hypothetical protein